MDAVQVLKDEYPGDAAWERFASTFRLCWERRADKGFYLEQLKDEEIAQVLSQEMGSRAISWFSSEIKALGGRTPEDVLLNEKSGLAVIRTLLMRMPR